MADDLRYHLLLSSGLTQSGANPDCLLFELYAFVDLSILYFGISL